MSFSLSGLTAYVDEQKIPLITRTLFGSQTGKIFAKQTGIKSSATVKYLNTSAQFLTAGCTWSPSGTTSITNRSLTVANIQVMESLCIKDLNAYYTQTLLRVGDNPSDLPFEQMYSTLKADYIAQQLEIAYWQGATTSWNANLNKFNGFISLIDTAAASVNGNPTGITTGTGIIAANVIGIFNGVYALIPAQILRAPDTAIFCGTDTFRVYAAAVVAANLYSYTGQTDAQFELTIPGTAIKVIGLDGLTGTNRIFAGRKSNFYIGTDMENEEEMFKMWESVDNGDYRFKADFKAGVQVAIPSELVSFKLV